ncbi:MAG TPA: hypothetical protein VI413_12275 [Paludibacter sp.]
MNHKYIIAILLLIALSNNLTAQKTIVGFDTGFGTYEMTQNKLILENSMKSNPLQPQSIHNFPGYLYFRPYLGVEYRYLNIGIAYTLMSTGSRYSIHDYSGEYKFDAQIIGHAGGLFAEIPIYTIQRFKFLIAAEGGIIFNKMKLEETFQLNVAEQYNQQSEYNLLSDNFFIKPYLKAEYKIREGLCSTFSIGYHKDIIAKNMNLESDDSGLTNFIADWDGIRASIGLSF